MCNTFDDIRPYRDEEVNPVLRQLIQDPQFVRIIEYVFPDKDPEQVKSLLASFDNQDRFQSEFIGPMIFNMIRPSSSGVNILGKENVTLKTGQLYISNHRDILLDASILNSSLAIELKRAGEVAIGDNLFVYPWIEHLAKLNKSFVVRRNLSIRQQLEASCHLSEYMHDTIERRGVACWIAQREGRAKDSNDRTAEAILKMLNLGGSSKCVLENLMNLNIAPLSFTYEYDPCDYLKAQEMQEKRDNPDYEKSPASDLLNMQTGVLGRKGAITLHFAPPINSQLAAIDPTTPKKELFSLIARMIDQSIHSRYTLYPHNYVALDLLQGTPRYAGRYTEDDRTAFEAYVEQQLEKITLAQKDLPFLREKIYTMYANLAKNYEAATAQ